MPLLRIGEKSVAVDELGFMLQPDDWDEEVAVALADNRSLGPLSEAHWQVVIFIREYYLRYKTAPMLRAISKRTGLSERRLKELFPAACRECMCLVAGLTQPSG